MNLYYFNPTCEMAIANNYPHYMIPKSLSKLSADLEYLPLIFAQKDDAVLVDRYPSEAFINDVRKWKINIPKFTQLNDLVKNESSIKQIYPWGWSPACVAMLNPLASQCSISPVWNPVWRTLSSRTYALDILKGLLLNTKFFYTLPKSKLPIECFTLSEVVRVMDMWGTVVLKSPWSASGRGVLILRQPQLNQSNIQWIGGVLKSQKSIIVEPYLDKTHDFSFHFFIDEEGEIHNEGISTFSTLPNGQYSESFVYGKSHAPSLPIDTSELQHAIHDEIRKSEYPKHYKGYLGVDALIYKEGGKLLIHPIVEINMRRSMGTVSIFFEKYLSPESFGVFRIEHYKNTLDLHNSIQLLKQNNPLVIEQGLIKSGFISLSDLEDTINNIAFFIIKSSDSK